jgi:hypothetical protein
VLRKLSNAKTAKERKGLGELRDEGKEWTGFTGFFRIDRI